MAIPRERLPLDRFSTALDCSGNGCSEHSIAKAKFPSLRCHPHLINTHNVVWPEHRNEVAHDDPLNVCDPHVGGQAPFCPRCANLWMFDQPAFATALNAWPISGISSANCPPEASAVVT